MNVLILGATGRTGSFLADYLANEPDVNLALYVRSPEKLSPEATANARVIVGDVLETEHLHTAMEGVDCVAACLAGRPLEQAQSIAAALENTQVSRIMWLTGLGIHHEVPGPVGEMLNGYVQRQPEFVEAADVIERCSTPSLLVRAPMLTDGPETPYVLHREGEELPGDSVSRATLARFFAHAVTGDVPLCGNESLGVIGK